MSLLRCVSGDWYFFVFVSSLNILDPGGRIDDFKGVFPLRVLGSLAGRVLNLSASLGSDESDLLPATVVVVGNFIRPPPMFTLPPICCGLLFGEPWKEERLVKEGIPGPAPAPRDELFFWSPDDGNLDE